MNREGSENFDVIDDEYKDLKIQRLVVVGDLVTDVVFPNESPMSVALAKETITSGEVPDQSAIIGLGGAVYLRDAMKILFDTYYPDVMKIDRSVDVGKKKESEYVYKMSVTNQMDEVMDDWKRKPSEPKQLFGSVNYWTLAKRPLVMSRTSECVYRAVGKQGGRVAGPYPSTQTDLPELGPGSTSSPKPSPDILVISDHDRFIRSVSSWGSPSHHKHWLTEGCHVTENGQRLPRRVILLANRLPAAILGQSSDKPEPLWEVLLEEGNEAGREATVVVTSIDRLRQEGANISKRLSWDKTLVEFRKELENFAPLKRLSSFGHLVVRIGVVGAIHCYWSTESGERRLESKVVYDPNADQLVFRDRLLQGNAFGIRPILPACIAFRIMLRLMSLEKDLAYYDKTSKGMISRAISDAIGIAQQTYRMGFGRDRIEAIEFIENLDRRYLMMRDRYLEARVKQLQLKKRTGDETFSRGQTRSTGFVHIARIPEFKNLQKENETDWSLLRDNFRVGIKQGELQDESGEDFEKSLEDLLRVEKLRRIRMARAIVFFGIERAVNLGPPMQTSLRQWQSNETRADYLRCILRDEEAFDDRFSSQLIGEVSKQQDLLSRSLLPEWHSDGLDEHYGRAKNDPMRPVPFSAPVGVFGELKVMGRRDGETFSSIRNLLSNHLGSEAVRPLSIAVFGKPGSGKSFGVTCLAETMAADRIEKYVCNLSQLKNRDDLDTEFFRIMEILLKGKTPLVFFDEFDGSKDREDLYWLKYFIAPMQDRFYKHPHGMIDLKNSIFVFAGGTTESFGAFSEVASKAIPEKGPDFLSRINGFVDIGGLDTVGAESDGEIPYLRRASILRSEFERDRMLLDENRVAQIDRNIVDALLQIPSYFFGARSIGGILRMCMKWNGRIEKSSLPTSQQLKLHVDPDEFLRLVEGGGRRPS